MRWFWIVYQKVDSIEVSQFILWDEMEKGLGHKGGFNAIIWIVHELIY